MVFTSVTASAPSSRATRAIATISGSTGDSLTDIGLVPAARQRRTSSRSPSGVAPNSRPPDRKSTRLNSSHRCISYAVFCLKKKKYHHQIQLTVLVFVIIPTHLTYLALL